MSEIDEINNDVLDMFPDPIDNAENTPETTIPTPNTETNNSEAGVSEEAPIDKTETDTNTDSGSEDAGTNNDSETKIKNDVTPHQEGTSDKTEEPFNAEAQFDKKNTAFAALRVQKREYEEFLMRMAKTAGVEASNAKEAKELLEANLQKVEAKKRNVDPEVLKELEESKKALSEYQQESRRKNALEGFQKVKSLHGLSDKELGAFADQLMTQATNPFEQDVDLVREYRMLNFDTLLAKAREEGRQAEIARNKKATDSSSTPGTHQGVQTNTGDTPKEITNTNQLTAFFAELGLK